MGNLSFPKTTFLGSFLEKKIYSSTIPLSTPFFSLLNIDCFPKFFFRSKTSSKKHLAIGALLETDAKKALEDSKQNLPFYGTIFFDKKIDETWESFEKDFFFIPRFEIIEEENNLSITYYSFSEEKKDLTFEVPLQENPSIEDSLIFKKHTPNFETWKKILEKQINAICENDLDKIVLCRKTEFSFEKKISFSRIIKTLLTVPNSHAFGYIISPTCGFFGASPETLFTKKKNLLQTEAVASTRRRGIDEKEDLLLEVEMKQNPKDLLEFSTVCKMIEKTLSSFSKKIKKDPLTIYKNPYIQHLLCTFTAVTKENSYSIIKKLHPTPAICGHPKVKALKVIRSLEPFSRRLYSSILGIKSKDKEEYIVAIRSFVINNHKLSLFSGLGVVESSDPTAEWEELELKTNAILKSGGFVRAAAK